MNAKPHDRLNQLQIILVVSVSGQSSFHCCIVFHRQWQVHVDTHGPQRSTLMERDATI